jgi:hypothetical protein
MNLREAAQQSLEALELHLQWHESGCVYLEPAVIALRAALAEDAMQRLTDVQQEMERKPLTKEQLLYVYNELPNWGMDMDSLPKSLEKFARAIERAHGIGGEE